MSAFAELVRKRWSPRSFQGRPVSDDALRTVFEAARWAPSSSNEQPWRYVVARRGRDAAFERIAQCLDEGNRRWAPNAPVLGIAFARKSFTRSGRANRHNLHDTGMANMALALQATDLGLGVHFMAGFDPELAVELLGAPADFQAVAALALGHIGHPSALPEDLEKRERRQRERRPVSETVFSEWDRPAAFLGT